MSGSEGRSRDWPFADDLIASIWLLSLLGALLAALAISAYLVVSGRIAFDFTVTGTLNIGALIEGTLIPLFWIGTILAFMEIYGRKAVRSLLENYNPPARDRRQSEEGDEQ